jgi:hypothetical protein
VAAYHLTPDGEVRDLLGDGRTIDERELGRVVDDLSAQMNRILLKKGPSR